MSPTDSISDILEVGSVRSLRSMPFPEGKRLHEIHMKIRIDIIYLLAGKWIIDNGKTP